MLREEQGLQVLILLFENVNCLAVMLSSGFNRFLVPGQPCRSGILTSLVAFSSIINSENIEGSDWQPSNSHFQKVGNCSLIISLSTGFFYDLRFCFTFCN